MTPPVGGQETTVAAGGATLFLHVSEAIATPQLKQFGVFAPCPTGDAAHP